MEWNTALLFLTSLFVIQNVYCVETEIFREDTLKRFKYLEDKVAAQGAEIEQVHKTNAQLQKSNNDLRKIITELMETNNDLRETLLELKETTNMYSTDNALLPGSDAKQRRAYSQTYQRKTFNRKDLMSSGKLERFLMNNEGPIAFTAAISPLVVDHLKHMDTIKFETVITDIGGGYNNQSGVFVAPATGIYMFSCSLMDHNEASGVMVHAEIVQNQRVLGRIFAHAEGGSYRDQGAQTVFTHVNQGDQIWVRTIDNPDLGLGGELYSTFSGYLLFAM